MATDGTAPLDSSHLPIPIEPALQWDGDRMFNIYIHDYCLKRGFVNTAKELQAEALIPASAQPPINAKQGLLFEWWSVFWVLFTAKSNGAGPEEALLYTQHQAQAQAAAQKPQPRPAQGAQVRFPVNGQRPPNSAGGPPNGIVAPPGQQTGSLPNGTQSTVPFPGNAPQPNGIAGPSAGPQGGPAPPQGPNMAQGPPPNQRSGPPQQRSLNGGSFQSPQLAHSPPNTQHGGVPPHNGMASVGQNQPLTQMRGPMHPPNGPPGPQQPPPYSFGRSPSNPGSPAVHPSPSMPHRQVPGTAGIPMSPEMLAMELSRIPPPTLFKCKQEIGLGDKDISTMTLEEKQTLVAHFRRSKPPNAPGPSNVPPGQPGSGSMQPPSGLRTMSHPQNMNVQQSGQPPMQPSQGQIQQQRGAKRNSTSPGQEAEQLPNARNESSPRENKRVRRSPAGEHQPPPMTPMYAPQHPSQQPGPPGPPMQPPMGPNSMMQRQGQMSGMQYNGPPMPMANPMLGHAMGTPQMSPMQPPMNQQMMQSGQGVVMNSMHQYRQAMQNIHKPPSMPQHMMPGGAGSPAADGQGGQQGNRMQQGKPMGMMPPPPPSPAMAPKNTPSGSKQEDNGPQNGRVDSSPQNGAIAGVPGQNHPGGPSQTNTPAPPTPNPSGNGQMTVPSPSQILNSSTAPMSNHAPQVSNHHPPPPPPPSSNPAEALDFDFQFPDFDVAGGLMGGDSSINFERDFAAWFDPENSAV